MPKMNTTCEIELGEKLCLRACWNCILRTICAKHKPWLCIVKVQQSVWKGYSSCVSHISSWPWNDNSTLWLATFRFVCGLNNKHEMIQLEWYGLYHSGLYICSAQDLLFDKHFHLGFIFCTHLQWFNWSAMNSFQLWGAFTNSID